MVDPQIDWQTLANLVTAGTLIGWTVKALKKLYKIFFPPGKHVRK